MAQSVVKCKDGEQGAAEFYSGAAAPYMVFQGLRSHGRGVNRASRFKLWQLG